MKTSDELRTLRHDFRQPVNVLRLTVANLRSRLLPMLEGDMAEYAAAKIDRIEKQAARLERLIDELREPEA